MGNLKKRGFSIIEFLLTLVIGGLLLAAVVLVWYSVEKTWLVERIQSSLIIDLETFAERFKKEISVSDANKIFFYPEESLSYEAISFPIAEDENGDGFIELDSEGQIIWDKTVIYHVFETAEEKTQLKRTVFAPRVIMSKEDRQKQINEVIINGQAIAGTPNGENAVTKFLFTSPAASVSQPIVLTIQPSAREFDAYNPNTARSKEISFGSTTLNAGEHYITFDINGTSQDGYKLGIDSFCLSPAGFSREAEECLIHSDSGKNKLREEMVNYGSWNGNRHLEYQSGDESDFISLKFYYDELIETNFHRCSPAETLIDYTDADGDGGTTGFKDYIVRLAGFGQTWGVTEQVGETVSEALNIPVSETGHSYRNVISYQVTDTGGSALRFKFDNCSEINALNIQSAALFERDEGSDGVLSSKRIITFNGNSSAVIPKGSSMWSDWTNMLDLGNFNTDVDYLVSFFVKGDIVQGMSSWPGFSQQSYVINSNTDYSQEADWPAHALPSNTIYALSAIEVSYYAGGTLTSRIYDTGRDNPDYATIYWNIVKNNYGDYGSGGLGANVILKVRSHDTKSYLLNDNDWSNELTIDTRSLVNGNGTISSLPQGRYIQFQVQFHSQPALNKYDYTKSCVLKKVGIKWPGESTAGGATIVNLSAYITTRPDYGKFSVKIDGKTLTKGLNLTLTLTKDVAGAGWPITHSITVEAEPRNTAK